MTAPARLGTLLFALVTAASAHATDVRAARQAEHPATPPKVRLLATGGTISNRAEGRLTAEDLTRSIPNLERYARVDAEQSSNVSSSELTLRQWVDLARRINELFRNDAELAGESQTFRIQGEDLQPVKARILLMLALAHTKDGADIQRMFTEY